MFPLTFSDEHSDCEPSDKRLPSDHHLITLSRAVPDSSCRQSVALICGPWSLICRHATKCEDLIEMNQSEIDFGEQRLVDSAARSWKRFLLEELIEDKSMSFYTLPCPGKL